MGRNSKISWTHHTFNAWWGCAKVSPGCAKCYAEGWANRTGFDIWGINAKRRFFGDTHWLEPVHWNLEAQAEGVRARVFCSSMSDVFEDREDLVPQRERLFRLIDATPNLDWLLLTKRPENIAHLYDHAMRSNVWMGVSAEDQKHWDLRVGILMDYVEAVVRFVSVEPMLGPVKLNGLVPDWVICGGESGSGCRPMKIDWACSLCGECSHRTRFFMKQLGGHPDKRDRLNDFPPHLRVQQIPELFSNLRP